MCCACALAFLGGTDYKGNKWMSSTTKSLLGFHSFSSADGTHYADRDQTQKTVSDILQYGQYVNAPMEIFIKNFSTPSDEMYWFSTREELALGIKVWDIGNERFIQSNYSGNKTYNHPSTHQNPSDFIKKYFNDLKHVPYSQTWNMLSSSMRQKVNLENYIKWWDGQVNRVVVERINELRSNVVKVKLKYYMKNGKITCMKDTFTLRKNGNSWLIDKQNYKKCK